METNSPCGLISNHGTPRQVSVWGKPSYYEPFDSIETNLTTIEQLMHVEVSFRRDMR